MLKFYKPHLTCSLITPENCSAIPTSFKTLETSSFYNKLVVHCFRPLLLQNFSLQLYYSATVFFPSSKFNLGPFRVLLSLL